MNKSNIFSKIKNRLVHHVAHFNFACRYPRVPIIDPLKIGTFYSQAGQDLFLSSILFNYLNNNQNSWIIDVGCNHPILYSNSLVFEKWFGCRVLAIDSLEEFRALWAKQRPAAIFLATAIGYATDSVVLRIPQEESDINIFSTITDGSIETKNFQFQERTVTCSKLANILSNHDIIEVLLMSIDIEGMELEAIKGIDFDKVMIRCIVLKNNSTNLYGCNDVRDYLKKSGYIFFARIRFLDDVFIHRSMINGLPKSLL